MAFAYHDHKNMTKLFAPTLEETLERSSKDPSAWENDKWWGGE